MDRRDFLHGGAALGIAASLSSVGLPSRAASTGGYKAIVNVFLAGGMDAMDTVLPMDGAEHQALRRNREDILEGHEANGSSRLPDDLLRVGSGGDGDGRAFGLPADLSAVHSMYENGDAALIGSVGPLIEPTSRAAIEDGTARLPRRLRSHNDQQHTWQRLGVDRSVNGWGGSFLDAGSDATNPFSAVSLGGRSMLTGATTRPYALGGAAIRGFSPRIDHSAFRENRDLAAAIFRQASGRDQDPDNLFSRDLVAGHENAVELSDRFFAAVGADSPLGTTFPATNLGRRLQRVAHIIASRGELGVSRQFFTVLDGGFDTHGNQVESLSAKHRQVDDALAAFRAAMIEMGVWNDVVLFTGSDFGRSLVNNGSGTDHGWGGHQIVAGGAVKGGQVYGDLPGYDPKGPDFHTDRGRIIPTTSVEQYAATMGRWFGLSDNELDGALPNLRNFDQRDMGFL